jgi:hypothetical protein
MQGRNASAFVCGHPLNLRRYGNDSNKAAARPAAQFKLGMRAGYGIDDGMDVSDILKAVLAPEYARGSDPLASLRVGDRLTGQVLRLEADGRALIDLGGFRALAQTTIDVQPGQMLQLKVARTGVPIQLRLDTPTPPAAQPSLPQMAMTGLLQPDEQQRLVRIIDRFLAAGNPPDDMVQDGKNAMARPDAVKIQHAPSNSDRIAPGTPMLNSAPNETVRQAMVVLRELLVPLPVGAAASVEQWATAVRSTIEDRSILFEIKLAEVLDHTAATTRRGDHPATKPALTDNPPNVPGDLTTSRIRQIMLRDLKPQLLVLKGLFSESQAGPASATSTKLKDAVFFRQTVMHLLSHVEQQQQRAVQRADGRDPSHVVAHVLCIEEGRQSARLKVYYPKHGRGGGAPPGHRIALLLDMDRLGPVRVDLSMTGQDLRILLHVRDADTRQRLDDHTADIAHALEGQFDHIHITTQVSREAIARFDSEDLEGPAVEGVDIHA